MHHYIEASTVQFIVNVNKKYSISVKLFFSIKMGIHGAKFFCLYRFKQKCFNLRVLITSINLSSFVEYYSQDLVWNL